MENLNSVDKPVNFKVIDFELTKLSIPIFVTDTISRDDMFRLAMYAAVPLYTGRFGMEQYEGHRCLCSILSFLFSVKKNKNLGAVNKWLKTSELRAQFVLCEDGDTFQKEAAKDSGYLTLYEKYESQKKKDDRQLPYNVLKAVLLTVGCDNFRFDGLVEVSYSVPYQVYYNFFSNAFEIRKNIILELLRLSKSEDSPLVITVRRVLESLEGYLVKLTSCDGDPLSHVHLLERYIIPQPKEFLSQFGVIIESPALERIESFLSSIPLSERPFLKYLYSKNDLKPYDKKYFVASIALAKQLHKFYREHYNNILYDFNFKKLMENKMNGS